MNENKEFKLEALVEPLCLWYEKEKRSMPWRDDATPYHVWLSEIMLQQTRIEAAKAYYDRFTKCLPDIPSLAAVSEEELLKLWEGLGYYNRARNLKKAASLLVERYDGRLPADYDLLLSLPGIGRYTAGAIASIAYGLAEPAVDGNVLRVTMRYLNCDEDIMKMSVRTKMEKQLRAIMPKDCPGEFNQALMELGDLCSIQYYLRFWLSICRASLAVSALRIVRYCLNVKSGCISRNRLYFRLFRYTPRPY